ncbi:MAG: monovalent cation/H+ antiporter subunit D family protein [Rhodospirillaceae bacterium]|nr:monovalent cation/H+ antiporter subunit D family protein [Rhodospirillaceae bacterium]MBT4219344.1 monovalent cation/H+ antiporter subunit D family protein [Rhodospirillaceae bacterium]MBT4464453.1 monovalent cation/H+ antiporter subunit D family protein [Rhodospirillaceae bacterium]MBT5014194.1 monovalent cation/H+ antiporter subunit D family protein [Rhodospirillaceae bacterium]MBT5308606.1 monovalent cation/H+ antiporter subunit D family protein [Rhodospirillaceae bacterium]
MASQLPILQVIVPLIAAPLVLLLRRSGAAWALTLLVTWSMFAIALVLLAQVMDGGVLYYRIGGWAAPWGIEYRLDQVGALVLVIVSGIGSVVIAYARASVEREIDSERIYLFYCMYLLCLTGLLGIAITGDVFNLFVFLEISSLSSYVLIALGRNRRALTAAYRYLIMGTIGATFYIIGVGLMYMQTGTLNIDDLATLIPAVADSRTIHAALAFLTVGICLKLALFPLHMWLPNAYAFAPSVVTAFLAATATKVAVYILIRIVFTVFGGVDVFAVVPLVQEALMGLALIGVFAASSVAIYQNDIKRMLAYSSVAQIGYIILGISLASSTGLTGGIIHLFNHALMKCTLFLAMGAVFMQAGGVSIRHMQGIGKTMPWTMAAFVIGGLSLIGVPLTVGFISKWYLILGVLEKGMWPVAGLVVLGSLLAVIYIWRVIEAAYFKDPSNDTITEAPLSMLAPMWVMALASVYFGIDATRTLDIATSAAQTLLGGGAP